MRSNDEQQEWDLKKWGTAVAGAIIIGVADLIAIATLNGLRTGIMAVGVITFFGVLTLANLLSRSSELDRGEVRMALAASIVFVYFSLLALTFSGDLNADENGLARSVTENFTTLVGIVVAFYFGTRAVEAWSARTQKQASEQK